MKSKDKEKDRKIDLIIKIILIIIIILLLIHNCMLQKGNKKPGQDVDTIDINCNGNQCSPVPKEIESLSFAQDTVSIKEGDSLELIVVVEPAELSSYELIWISSNKNIVEVDENGVITGVGVGTATITVRSVNGKIATCKVEVVKNVVSVDNIELKPKKLTMKAGSTTQITAVIKPNNATSQTLVWSSSNPSIATVNSKGVIKAIKPGKVTITVKTKDGKVAATSTITVETTSKEIESLSFVQKNVNIKKGDSVELIVTVKPTELSSSRLTWKSSDTSIVTVDENGVIKGIKEGTATITVTSSNGKKTTCKVEVVNNIVSVDSIELKPKNLTMKAGSTTQITAVIKPNNATGQTLIWSSSNPSIATVNSKGVIKAIKPGKVTITVKTKDGKVAATSTITVENASKQIESLSFAQKNVSIKKGDTIGLIVTVKPTELSSSQLTWKSSDTSIVTVDENGVIKGIKEGTATITVTSSNGKTATCTITVTTESIDVKEIELKPSEEEINSGSTTQIAAIIKPENATNRELVWTSSDESIATVDSNGIVSGLKAGTVVITAKTKDGKVVATTTITIKEETDNFEVYDNSHSSVEWNGATDLDIFSKSTNGRIAPESSDTYQFIVKNSTRYNLKYQISFIETNNYNINMKYKLKKNDTYIFDNYLSANELNANNISLNIGESDTYYLEWKWISSDNDTNIGKNPVAKYGLKIEVKAEEVND